MRFARSLGSLAGVGIVVAATANVESGPARLSGQVSSGAAPAPATVRIGVFKDRAVSVQTLPMEEYVAGVLAGEAARESPPAALETLAIAIRTYAAANVGRHGTEGFDLCDQTHCQVLRRPTAVSQRAVAATAGQVLLDGARPAEIFYSASCGGRTERPSTVWPTVTDHRYLPSQVDEACRGEPIWSAEVPAADLERGLRAAGYRGERLRNVRILSRTESGRVSRLRIEGFNPDELSGQDFRMLAGPVLIKSTAFEIERDGTTYRFAGRGYGHGVGLCVIGSVQLAADGRTAADILGKYYPGLRIAVPSAVVQTGATLQPAVATDVSLSLPPAADASRAALLALVREARAKLVSALSLPSTPAVSLRFHASDDGYSQATGLPWYTRSATVKGGEMHFTPLASLQAGGLLERAVRHEIVHALTDRYLAGRPLWVREGAAVYFSSDRKVEELESRPPCPTDRDLSQPTSAGGLATAYAEAASCFARQIAGGRSWLEVR